MTRTPLKTRILRAFFMSKFEPMETVLATSAVLHGLWLIFPGWRFEIAASLSGAPRSAEIVLAVLLFAAGLVHLFTIATEKTRLRRHVTLFKFVMWFFLTALSYSATDKTSIIWIAYSTLTAFSAIIYLNLSLGGRDNDV